METGGVSKQEMGWRNRVKCPLSHSVSRHFLSLQQVRLAEQHLSPSCTGYTSAEVPLFDCQLLSPVCTFQLLTTEFTVHLITAATSAFFSLRECGFSPKINKKKNNNTKRGASRRVQFSVADALWLSYILPKQHLSSPQTPSFLCKTGPLTSLCNKTSLNC